jgi:hypothetical protein
MLHFASFPCLYGEKMAKVLRIINHVTGRIIEPGYFSDITVEQCLRSPSEFEVVYDRAEPDPEAPTLYSGEALAKFSMKDLRDIYNSLAEEVETPPAPSTSKDGIIKAIIELQGR